MTHAGLCNCTCCTVQNLQSLHSIQYLTGRKVLEYLVQYKCLELQLANLCGALAPQRNSYGVPFKGSWLDFSGIGRFGSLDRSDQLN